MLARWDWVLRLFQGLFRTFSVLCQATVRTCISIIDALDELLSKASPAAPSHRSPADPYRFGEVGGVGRDGVSGVRTLGGWLAGGWGEAA